MEYLSISEIAKKWKISRRRVQVLCASGRVPGAKRVGSIWIVPSDAAKPLDARIHTGRYIGFYRKRM